MIYEWLIIYLELCFKLDIVLIFCDFVWTLVYIFVYIDFFYLDACLGKWMFIPKWCLKCYFEHLYFYIWCSDELFVYSLYLYALKPMSWILKSTCHSFCKILSLCMYYLKFFRYLFLCTYLYTLEFYIVIHKTTKLFFDFRGA